MFLNSNCLFKPVVFYCPLYCPGFRLSQLKPIKHKNRRPAVFASCANMGKLFFQWFLGLLIFMWKENNGNAIPEYRQVAPAHEGPILPRDGRCVQFGKRRRSRKAGGPQGGSTWILLGSSQLAVMAEKDEASVLPLEFFCCWCQMCLNIRGTLPSQSPWSRKLAHWISSD